MNECFTAVPGLALGHAHCAHARTGVTVITPASPGGSFAMAVDVRGGGPGTRETDALHPACLVERVHGLALAGGSVFGLAAADALALALSAEGTGLAMGEGLPPVPVVPAAILFDLTNGGDKAWGHTPPYVRLTLQALAARGQNDRSGPIGAGFGARAGSRPGGIGSLSLQLSTGHHLGVLLAVNSFGEVHAGAPPSGDVPMPKLRRLSGLAQQNTCIGAIATNMPLSRPQLQRLAIMAHDGLARAIRPIHTPFDGDSLFALSTAAEATATDPVTLTELGTRAADLVAAAARAAIATPAAA